MEILEIPVIAVSLWAFELKCASDFTKYYIECDMSYYIVMKLEDLQHERLIHLLVTLTFGICFVITAELSIVFQNSYLGWIALGLVCLLLPYIWHYFKLENQVQKKYK